MQGTWVRSQLWKDSICCGPAEPMHHNYWACVLQILKSAHPRTCETEKPRNEKPLHSNEEQTLLTSTRRSPLTTTIKEDPAQSKIKWINKKIVKRDIVSSNLVVLQNQTVCAVFTGIHPIQLQSWGFYDTWNFSNLKAYLAHGTIIYFFLI